MAAFATTSASAQTAAPAATAVQEVVVTGSRIKQPNLTTVSPVTSVSSQEIKLEGTQRVEDLVNNLPQVFASQGSTYSNGSTGSATVNLRGFGCQRTLVLIDGRRLMPGDPNAVCADLNLIPAALVERVDVVTGGASAIYGSDALAGVVNFIMKKNFEGVQIDVNHSFQEHDNANGPAEAALALKASNPAQFGMPASNWYGGASTDVNITVGVNSSNGKGNITAFMGYRNTEPVTQSPFDYSKCTLGNNGFTAYSCSGSSTTNPPRIIALDSANNQNFISGSKTLSKTSPQTIVPYSSSTGAFNFNPYNYFQRQDTRYTGGYNGHYDVNKALTVYSSFNFMDDHTQAQLAPSGMFFGNPYLINCNSGNPLLSANEISSLCNLPGAIPNAQGLDAFYIGRRNTEGGPRQEDYQHTQYRFVLGAKGDLDDAWSYDISGQYGATSVTEAFQNSLSKSHLANALYVVNAVKGAGGYSIVPVGTAGSAATCMSVVNGTDVNCVPYNIWSLNGVTQAAINYVSIPLINTATQTQAIVSGFVSGKLGKYGIQSPFADEGLNIVLGAEYRRDTLTHNFDEEYLSNDSTDGAAVNVAGATNVKEIFTELRAPLVSHKPFVEDLSVDVAYRRSTYNLAGTTDTYAFSGNWTPIRDIRFRGSFGRAVRAPNVTELFTPASFGLGGSTDPCAGSAPIYSEAQCAHTFPNTPAGQANAAAKYGNIPASPAGQYNTYGGGNTALRPEVSDTTSLGVVLQPRFIPGFNLTVDYFDINILGQIGTPGYNNILTDCIKYGTPALCNLIHRQNSGSLWTGDGTLGGTGYIATTLQNIGESRSKGFDFAANYRVPMSALHLSNFGRVDFNLVGTLLTNLYTLPITGVPGGYDCVGLYGPQCGTPNPAWRHKLRVTWSTPWKLDASVQWRYIGSVNLDGLGQAALGSNFGQYSYLDLAFTYKLTGNIELHGGVNNLLDIDPPLFITSVTTGTANVGVGPGNGNTIPSVYDSMGRTVFLGLTGKF